MKVTYTEQIERHRAFNKKMKCPLCGNNYYEIVKQIEPKCEGIDWFVRCPNCGAEGLPGPASDIAIARWKQLC